MSIHDPMHRVLITAILLCSSQFSFGEYEMTDREASGHVAEVYTVARDYILETFSLRVEKESRFNPVRFNSTGVWGGFEARVKELGNDNYEVQGWLEREGRNGIRLVWSAVIHYPVDDPNAWEYRRVDQGIEFEATPKITSWRLGDYRSVPYIAEYSKDFLETRKVKRTKGMLR